MCQLLGMNCNTPTDILFSFEGFCRRGGLTDQHGDGWGIGFFEGAGVRTFLDVAPSAHSQVAAFVRQYPIHAEHVIAHIRKATQGQIALCNTHPFLRELWGQNWLFAHNGNLLNYTPPPGQYYRPIGNTDSEAAFCQLLEALRQANEHELPFVELWRTLNRSTHAIRQHGVFNFLLSNGHVMFAHCSSELHYLVRQAPFPVAHLIDDDVSVDFAHTTTPNDRVAIIATRPLTDNEEWIAFHPNELKVFKFGAPLKMAGD